VSTRAAWGLVLVGVLAVAVGFRFHGLAWGLDDGFVFPDELLWAMRIRRFALLRWESFAESDLVYPTLYGYLSGVVGNLIAPMGWVPPLYTRNPDPAVLIARVVSAVAATGAVVAVAGVGWSAYGAFAGVVAAELLAVAPLASMQVRYASVDSLLVLWMTLAVAAAWRLMRTGGAGAALVAGAMVGLAFATKYTGLAAATGVAWAGVECAGKARSGGVVLWLGVIAAVGAVVAAVVACPPCALDPEALRWALVKHHAISSLAPFANNKLATSIGWWSRPWLHQAIAGLPYVLGLPFAVLGFTGVLAAAWRRLPADRLLLATVIPYFAYIGSSAVVFPRYLLPTTAVLALLAAAFLARVPSRAVAAVVAIVVVGYGFALTTSHLQRFSWQQQWQVARWIAANGASLPPEERRVGMPWVYGNYFALVEPLQKVGFKTVGTPDGGWFDAHPAFFVMPEWYAIGVRRDADAPRTIEQLAKLESGEAGYRPVHTIPIPHYLQYDVDTCLDPAYAIDLWQGAIGFTIYARNDVVLPSP
jgi:hypothetical protein